MTRLLRLFIGIQLYALTLAAPARGQTPGQLGQLRTAAMHVELVPQSAKTSLPTIGLVGVWAVGICNNSPATATIERTFLLSAAPALHAMPDNLAQDLMTRKSSQSLWATISDVGQETATMGSAGLAAVGLAKNKKVVGYSGVAVGLTVYLVSRATKRAPNPQPYFVNLLPQSLSLGPAKCSETAYFLVASLMHDQQTISVDLQVPQP